MGEQVAARLLKIEKSEPEGKQSTAILFLYITRKKHGDVRKPGTHLENRIYESCSSITKVIR